MATTVLLRGYGAAAGVVLRGPEGQAPLGHLEGAAHGELACVFEVHVADGYGLLGLFHETFGAPILPPHANSFLAWLAPDAVIDEDGRMRTIDPATEG